MTPATSATLPLAIGHELHLELGRTRAVVLALLATLCIASVTTGAVRVDRFLAPSANPHPPLANTDAGGSRASGSVPPAPALAREAHAEVEALATAVAKKYRIAPEATRGVVATAYREGLDIGLDPLLIIAVIAVESRFNPIAESDGGAKGLMQVIPGYHMHHVAAAGGDSVLDPRANIRLGALVLKDYIRRGGSESAGLQLYNGAADDRTNAYATKVQGEKRRLRQVIDRVRSNLHA